MEKEKEKFCCPECKDNVDIEDTITFREMAYEVAEKTFPQIWSQNRKEIKEMTKKEAAETFFQHGVELVLTGIEGFGKEV